MLCIWYDIILVVVRKQVKYFVSLPPFHLLCETQLLNRSIHSWEAATAFFLCCWPNLFQGMHSQILAQSATTFRVWNCWVTKPPESSVLGWDPKDASLTLGTQWKFLVNCSFVFLDAKGNHERKARLIVTVAHNYNGKLNSQMRNALQNTKEKIEQHNMEWPSICEDRHNKYGVKCYITESDPRI